MFQPDNLVAGFPYLMSCQTNLLPDPTIGIETDCSRFNLCLSLLPKFLCALLSKGLWKIGGAGQPAAPLMLQLD